MSLIKQPEKSGHKALRRGRCSLPGHVYLVTTATLDRQEFFTDFQAACAAVCQFVNPRILGDACLLAWVLMPDHVHWLLQLGDRDRLAVVVNRMKSASARGTNRVIGRQGGLWQPAYHDHALRKEQDLKGVARYIIANPLRAGLVRRVGDYPFWNACWF
jgi:REP element-mobilizing transposase RayT